MSDLNTDDAMVWAEEFCRTFDGWIIRAAAWEEHLHELSTGTMVGWFANAIETAKMHPDANTLWRVLVGDRFELFMNNATFHHSINLIKDMIPVWIDALAAMCERQAAEDELAIRVMEQTPFSVEVMREQIRKMDEEGLQ